MARVMVHVCPMAMITFKWHDELMLIHVRSTVGNQLKDLLQFSFQDPYIEQLNSATSRRKIF